MSLPFDSTVLFFVAGILIAAAMPKSRLPTKISALLSRFLLVVIGIKGGVAVSAVGVNSDAARSVFTGIIMALVVPALGFPALRKITTRLDAAAIAASYGSVSVVTFVTAASVLEGRGTLYGGYMAAVMALMESPAIFMAIVLSAVARSARGAPSVEPPLRRAFLEAITDRTQLLLLAALGVGFTIGAPGGERLSPMTGAGFQLALALFLLDMSGEVARQIPLVRHASPRLLLYAVCGPLVHAALALSLAVALNLTLGDATLLMVLAASASYIVAPAVIRHAIPEANPALYLGLSLGITFPFNIIIGIPI